MLFILAVLTVLLWQRFDSEVEQYSALQKTLMQQQALQSAKNIEEELNHIRSQMSAISLDDLWLEDLSKFQRLVTVQESMRDRLKLYFPKMHAYLIASETGDHIGGDLNFFVGAVCQHDIKNLATMFRPDVDYFEYEPYIHAKPDNYHFDVMIPVFAKGRELIFYMSFNANILTRILKNHVISEHYSFLVRKDVPDLIEVTPEFVRDKLQRPYKLSQQELDLVGATELIPHTRWKMIVIENPQVIADFKQEKMLDVALISLVMLVMWSAVLWLGLHHETRRGNLVSKLNHMSMHDVLTGLANRRKITQEVAYAIDDARYLTEYSAVLYMDLDGFKEVNDTYGHDAGDAVLVELANRLKDLTRSVDVVARMGGDEFVVLLKQLGEHPDSVKNILDDTLKRIEAKLQEHYRYKKTDLNCPPSIGVVLIDGENHDATSVIAKADKEMYRVKKMNKASSNGS